MFDLGKSAQLRQQTRFDLATAIASMRSLTALLRGVGRGIQDAFVDDARGAFRSSGHPGQKALGRVGATIDEAADCK